jgi:hypothetical protein
MKCQGTKKTNRHFETSSYQGNLQHKLHLK